MFHTIYKIIYLKLILPFKESHAPRKELSLGAAIGMFWAINPLVGIQMYLVTLTWFICKFIKIRFHLPVAIAMVWITNPITMPFFYYTFYITGIYALQSLQIHVSLLSFDKFQTILQTTISMPLLEGIWYWIQFLLDDFGIPALIGGLIWAIPLSILTYPITYRLLTQHRIQLANKENLTLEEWEKKHIHTFKEILQWEKEGKFPNTISKNKKDSSHLEKNKIHDKTRK